MKRKRFSRLPTPKRSKKNNGPSYTDALLCTYAYKYRKHGMLLITANHKDIPSSMFDRIELITIDVKNELRTEAIYRLSNSKLNKIIKDIE